MNQYTKGLGDCDQSFQLEPTDAEIVSCIKNNASDVAKKCFEFDELLLLALTEYCEHGTTDGFDLLANASAEYLLLSTQGAPQRDKRAG